MNRAVLVAGMRGVGKSTLLGKYGDQTIALEAEEIQAEAVRIAKGPNVSSPYDWGVWDQELICRAPNLLHRSIDKLHPAIHEDGRALLIVGSILVQDWFRQAFLEALKERFPEIHPVACLLLHLDPKTISEQIRERGRESESAYVNDYLKIERERDGYWRLAGADWQQVTSHAELHQLIKAHV